MEPLDLRKSFVYKLCPSPGQERLLDRNLMLCRHIYNCALEQRKAWWARGQRKAATFAQQSAELPELKKACPEFTEVNAQVLQDVLHRLDKAFKGFFRRVKAGDKPGYPRFQGRTRYHSFTYPQFGIARGARLDNGYLVLSKIGRLKVHWSRPLEGTPKTVTISHEADGWYASFSCADVAMQPTPLTGQESGIDLGLESFATLADGSRISNPRIFRVAELALKRAQRRVSRRKRGSHRRRKAVVLLAKAYQRVQRTRQDFHFKTAAALVRQYDVIYYEDLRVANMVQNHHLAKSISDAGWGAFLTILAFKAACAGKRVVGVNPAYTSQACSGCGVLVQKGLSVRWHLCPACGTSLHRDHNAALNILALGTQLSGAGQAPQALTWASGPSVA